MTGFGRVASGVDVDGVADVEFDSIDESLNKMLETELGESMPVREKIANATPGKSEDSPVQSHVVVDIGDRVRQVQ